MIDKTKARLFILSISMAVLLSACGGRTASNTADPQQAPDATDAPQETAAVVNSSQSCGLYLYGNGTDNIVVDSKGQSEESDYYADSDGNICNMSDHKIYISKENAEYFVPVEKIGISSDSVLNVELTVYQADDGTQQRVLTQIKNATFKILPIEATYKMLNVSIADSAIAKIVASDSYEMLSDGSYDVLVTGSTIKLSIVYTGVGETELVCRTLDGSEVVAAYQITVTPKVIKVSDTSSTSINTSISGTASGTDTTTPEFDSTMNVTTWLTASSVSFMKLPSRTSEQLGTYRAGKQAVLLGTKNGWAKCKIDSLTGYVLETEIATDEYTSTISENGWIASGSTARIYAKASTAASNLGTVESGTKLTVLAKGNGWWKVRVNSTTGYVQSVYITQIEPAEATSTPSSSTGDIISGSGSSGTGEVIGNDTDNNGDHIHNYRKSTIVSPTCIENGYTVYICSCGLSYKGDGVLALGHQPVSAEDGYAATCTEDGMTDSRICSRCGTTIQSGELIPATGHTDSDNDGICDFCGEVVEIESEQ